MFCQVLLLFYHRGALQRRKTGRDNAGEFTDRVCVDRMKGDSKESNLIAGVQFIDTFPLK